MPAAPHNADEGTYFQRLMEQLRSVNGARPRERDLPKVPAALVLYQVTAWITGVMLLLLCAEMVIKYGFGHWVYAFMPGQPVISFPLVGPDDIYYHGVNLSIGVLIAHGWLYVVYLFANFRLWSLMRMSFTKFIQIALGGVIPFMSFITESIITRQVRKYLQENYPEYAKGRKYQAAVPVGVGVGSSGDTSAAGASAAGAGAAGTGTGGAGARGGSSSGDGAGDAGGQQ